MLKFISGIKLTLAGDAGLLAAEFRNGLAFDHFSKKIINVGLHVRGFCNNFFRKGVFQNRPFMAGNLFCIQNGCNGKLSAV